MIVKSLRGHMVRNLNERDPCSSLTNRTFASALMHFKRRRLPRKPQKNLRGKYVFFGAVCIIYSKYLKYYPPVHFFHNTDSAGWGCGGGRVGVGGWGGHL